MKYESQHTLFYQFHHWLIFQKLQKQGQCAGQTIPDGEHPRLRCAWEYNGPLRRPPHTRSTDLGLFSFRGKKKKTSNSAHFPTTTCNKHLWIFGHPGPGIGASVEQVHTEASTGRWSEGGRGRGTWVSPCRRVSTGRT